MSKPMDPKIREALEKHLDYYLKKMNISVVNMTLNDQPETSLGTCPGATVAWTGTMHGERENSNDYNHFANPLQILLILMARLAFVRTSTEGEDWSPEHYDHVLNLCLEALWTMLSHPDPHLPLVKASDDRPAPDNVVLITRKETDPPPPGAA